MNQQQFNKGTVIFSHGKEGHPAGAKIVALGEIAERHGYRCESTDYRGLSIVMRQEKLLSVLQETEGDTILVGSSMGGYVSLSVALQCQSASPVQGLFLLAPAIGMGHYPVPYPDASTCTMEIVHGLEDTIVPVAQVASWCMERDVALHLFDDGHRLMESLSQVCLLFSAFLLKISTP